MDRKAISFLCVGVLAGALISSAVFAYYTRQLHASQSDLTQNVLRLAHALDPSHPVHRAMERMAEIVAERSGGRLVIEIYPSGQLGSEADMVEQVRSGGLAMTKISAAPLANSIPPIAVFGVPYIFRDAGHYWRVLDGPIGQDLLHECEREGLMGLCYYDAGARSFYTIKRPVTTPADLAGLNIRVQQSQTAIEMVRALGGAPTPIDWGELYTALQNGTVDGAENNPPSFYSSRHFEVCKFYALDEHTMVPDVVVMNLAVWQSLSPLEQQWVRDAAVESSVYQRELWKEESQRSLELVQEAGVEVSYPDKQPFVDRVSAMHEAYADKPAGPYLRRILEAE